MVPVLWGRDGGTEKLRKLPEATQLGSTELEFECRLSTAHRHREAMGLPHSGSGGQEARLQPRLAFLSHHGCSSRWGARGEQGCVFSVLEVWGPGSTRSPAGESLSLSPLYRWAKWGTMSGEACPGLPGHPRLEPAQGRSSRSPP